MNTSPSIIVAIILIPNYREQQYQDYQREINRPGRLCSSCGTDMIEPDHVFHGYAFCHDCFCKLERCVICEEHALELHHHSSGRVCIECINI